MIVLSRYNELLIRLKRILVLIFLLFVMHSAFPQNTILWEVRDTATSKRSFIVGTFHQFGNSFVDSIPQLKDALLKSELAIFESIDDGAKTISAINARMPSTGIDKNFNERDIRKLNAIGKNLKVDIYKIEPIELLFALQQQFQTVKCKAVSPTDTWDHFDNYLIHLAKINGIKLLGLETDSLQLSLIKEYSSPDWKEAKKSIRYWIKKLSSEKTAEGDCLFTNQYRKFQLDYELTVECPDDILITQRNEAWMKIIPDLISANNCFIAIGFLHLNYTCGLLEQLKTKGFLVSQVALTKTGQ
ncbi:MAG: hypothetical protein RI909_1896 [Bacteroidota bacterium]